MVNKYVIYMNSIEIKRFDVNKLEQLAKDQTAIYNQAGKKIVDFEPATEEDVIKRFQRKEFDPLRMFYAFQGDKMIGYAGLTGRDKEKNHRGVGYPWLLKDVPENVRDQLYEGMQKQCKDEGTKTMRGFASERNPEILNFYKSKGFEINQEFLVHQKQLIKNNYTLPQGYKMRPVTKDDLPKIADISNRDPKMKTPFDAKGMAGFMDTKNYHPDDYVVAEKNGTVVGFYGINIPNNPKNDKIFFFGVATDPDHQEIEVFLMKELENRGLAKGKKIFEMMFFPDSLRLPSAKERGFKQVAKNYILTKSLS